MITYGSRQVASFAIAMALTKNREDEVDKKKEYAKLGVRTAAVDCGGSFVDSAVKFVESAVVAAKREGVIKGLHSEEGAIAGATREALNQIAAKAVGFSVGGKIGMARYGDHISVAVFFGIGLLHLDEVTIALGHRAIS